jgi:uncharacterized protein (TIGR00304 family)
VRAYKLLPRGKSILSSKSGRVKAQDECGCITQERELETASVTELGFLLIIVGFVLAFIAMILLVVQSSRGSSQGRGAGVLLIGPIPIVFGTDKQSVKAVMLLAIVLILLVLVIMLLPSLLGR